MPYRAWEPSPDSHDVVTFHQDEMKMSFGTSHIHTAYAQTLLSLLYNLSNQNLDYTGHRILASMMDSPGWDTVLPHLRGVLAVIDPNIMQAIAEGLFKESIRMSHPEMLELSIDLGADPTQRIQYFNAHEESTVISTPFVAICKESSQSPPWRQRGLEELVLSLLRREPHISDKSLLWVIRAGCHTIAEHAICSQPERAFDFSIAVSDLEEGPWLGFNTYDSVTPLLVACSDPWRSAEKRSLVRCLLERNINADLKAMIAAAGAGDAELVSLLHRHGSPVNGFISELGTPLSSACNAALVNRGSTAISALLELGASPNDPESREVNSWEHSPLHILALADDKPEDTEAWTLADDESGVTEAWALADDESEVTEALALLLKNGADINHRASFYQRKKFRGQLMPTDCLPGWYGRWAETALEYAIVGKRWISANQLLSASHQLTGREILFMYPTANPSPSTKTAIGREYFRQFIRSLLTKAPEQAAARHWNGRTVLQCAVQGEDEDVILALFNLGVKPTPSDFMYMMTDRKGNGAILCRLSSSIQMKLALAAMSSQYSITDASMIRPILAFACPGVVRYVLACCPDVYDSGGLCYVVARIASGDRVSYFCALFDENEHEDCLTIEDLAALVSRRTISNMHEVWEGTAVSMAARAGRADILRILIGCSYEDLCWSGFIPAFILKNVLITYYDSRILLGESFSDRNSRCLGIWIEYCRMDDPIMSCSPLTAAAMVVPETTALEVVDLLLAQGYHPDGWTILIASCRGYVSILQRLKRRRLQFWPHILHHDDRPDWCPTALQIAVYHARVAMVKYLLDAGTMIDALDSCPSRPFYCFLPHSLPDNTERILPRTALQHAVEKENSDLVDILVNAGANVNAPAAIDSGATALQIASIRGSIMMVQYLLSLGADAHAQGAAKHGRTALQGAAEHGRKDVVELLAKDTTLAAKQHREKLVDAVFYAKKNAQHVVARILRESVFPPWSPEDEETIDMLDEGWESSSGNSALRELKAEIEDWKETFEDRSESSSAYESVSNFDDGSEDLAVEHSVAPQEDGSGFSQGIEWDVEDLGGSDSNVGDAGISQGAALAEEETTWLDFPGRFEEHDADQMLIDDFLDI